MRDAFGGTFMIKLGLIFIVIYITFMGIIINYSKAFRVKNRVINIIEQYQYEGEITDSDQAVKKIREFLTTVPHEDNDALKNNCKSTAEKMGKDYNYIDGICIITMAGDKVKKFGESERYYKVITYVQIDFYAFNLGLTIPISGETKIISINNTIES